MCQKKVIHQKGHYTKVAVKATRGSGSRKRWPLHAMAQVIDFVVCVTTREEKNNIHNVHEAAAVMFGVPEGNVGQTLQS